MAGGMPASASPAPASQRYRRHQTGRFACGKSYGCLERGHPVTQGLCVLVVQTWLPNASLLQDWWPLLHLQLGCCVVPHESEEFFLGVTTRFTGSENNCGSELKNTRGRILKDSVRSHACFIVVMLKYGPHSRISIT